MLHVCATESSPDVLSGSLQPRTVRSKFGSVTRQGGAHCWSLKHSKVNKKSLVFHMSVHLTAAWPGLV